MTRAKYVVYVIENDLICDTSAGTWEQYYGDTFSPETKVVWFAPLAVIGKTYKQKKESLRNFVKDLQFYDCGGMSYGEMAMVDAFIQENAKRYGLLNEFRSEGIVA